MNRSSTPRLKRTSLSLNNEAILISHGVIGALFLYELFIVNLGLISKLVLGVIVVLVWLIGIARLKNIGDINNKPAFYTPLYHLLVGAAFVVFAKPGSMYIFVWLMLVYRANHAFGKKGALLSLASLSLTLELMIVKLLMRGDMVSGLLYTAGAQFLIIASISMFFVDNDTATLTEKKVLKKTAGEAELEGQRLLSLINSMADGVIATDEQGVIKLFNASALNILDTNTDLHDRNITDCVSIIDQSRTKIDVLGLVTSKKVVSIYTDYFLVYPDGDKINVFLSISPIKIGFNHESESGYIIAFRDITREKSLEEERNEFISVVSHELRTPIAITEANISNAQFIVTQGKDVGAVKNALEAAHRQALYLANMINDLSTLSRAERGKLDMIAEDISPLEIVRSLYDDYKRDAEDKKLELKTEIAENVPEMIRSNRLYVREIMQNFVTNSIKYTKEGHVLISVAPKDGGVEFSVRDTGIGISKADQKRVFDKFFRSEDYRTRESSGTGLGLYITQKLIKIIGAKVDLKSQLNVGSTFTIYVPSIENNPDNELKPVA